MNAVQSNLLPLDFPWCELFYLASLLDMPPVLLHDMGCTQNWNCRISSDADDPEDSVPLTEWNVLDMNYGLRERLLTGLVLDFDDDEGPLLVRMDEEAKRYGQFCPEIPHSVLHVALYRAQQISLAVEAAVGLFLAPLHALRGVCDAYCLEPSYLYALCLAVANDDFNDPQTSLAYTMNRPKGFLDFFELPESMRLHLLIRYFSRYQVDFYPEFSLPTPVVKIASSVQ